VRIAVELLGWWYGCVRALWSGKHVFYVPKLNRVCFASSVQQCRAKFLTHDIRPATWWLASVFVVVGVLLREGNDANPSDRPRKVLRLAENAKATLHTSATCSLAPAAVATAHKTAVVSRSLL